jgi:ribosomal protein S18 acetylase RimI-like enzyme
VTAATLEDLAADTPTAVAACLPVLRELRPHLGAASAVEGQLARQAAQGYRLLAARGTDGKVRALAGWRLMENTVYGRFLYVDDLVTAAAARGQGLGDRLIDALVERARAAGCAKLVLDSGLTNGAAHRFYFRKRLTVGALHFSLAID